MEETVLREQLRTVDESLLFLLLIVLSVLAMAATQANRKASRRYIIFLFIL